MIDHSDILLGVGGSTPGVEAYGAISGRCETLLSLSKGQSVYAVSVSPDGSTVVAGTKSGDLHWLAPGPTDLGNQPDAVWHIDHGAPILAVCFTETLTLAVADTAGRCLLWQLGAAVEPVELPTGKRVVYSLFRPDDTHLVGLSLCGRLLAWDLRENTLESVLEVPRPPDALAALIRPVYWKAADAWVWSGTGGTVVSFNWQRSQVRTSCPHTDSVYVTLVCQEELLTIDRAGSMRRWRAGTDEPLSRHEVPKGVISAAAWGEQQSRMLLVNDSGAAGIYSWDGDHFDLITRLAGGDYRIVVGPDIEQFKSAVRRQKMITAEALADRARDKIKRRAWDELGPLYQQLAELGFGYVAWALRGQEAGAKDDMVAELTAYHELFRIVPPERPESRRFLARYAELLETTWRLRAAERMYGRLLETDPNNDDFQFVTQRLSQYATIAKSGRYVIETDIPLSLLVRSAMALGEAFVGRWLVKNIERPVSCRTHISAPELIDTYEQLRRTKTQSDLPQARQVELWQVSRQKADKVATVLFANAHPDTVNRLEYAVSLFNTGPQTVIRRMTLFNAGQQHNGTPVEHHNRMLCEHLQSIESAPWRNNAWLQMVDESVSRTIRQLRTRGWAKQFRELGGYHE